MERVEERLAHYLLQISANQSSITLFIPETLSRKLKYLEDHNYIKRTGKHITILDPDALENI